MFGWGRKQKAIEIYERIQIIIDDIRTNWDMFADEDGRIIEYTKDMEAALIGICSYYVASINSPKVATQITELYRKSSDNAQYIGADLLLRLNSAYQEIRKVTDDVQQTAKSMGDIFLEQSEAVINILGIESNENNRGLIIDVLGNFLCI